MSYYWQTEFKQAWDILLTTLYTVKGYSYSSEPGSGGKDQDLQIKLIGIKADIEKDKRKGRLHYQYKHYAVLIYEDIQYNEYLKASQKVKLKDDL